jgi:hypothetical protein
MTECLISFITAIVRDRSKSALVRACYKSFNIFTCMVSTIVRFR